MNLFVNWGEFSFVIRSTNLTAIARLLICLAKLIVIVVVAYLVYFLGGNELVYLAWLVVNLAFCFWHQIYFLVLIIADLKTGKIQNYKEVKATEVAVTEPNEEAGENTERDLLEDDSNSANIDVK